MEQERVRQQYLSKTHWFQKLSFSTLTIIFNTVGDDLLVGFPYFYDFLQKHLLSEQTS